MLKAEPLMPLPHGSSKSRPIVPPGAANPGEASQYLILLLLGAAAYLYLNLFVLPHTPRLLGGDQVYFWTYARRMLHGERIYLDFLQFTPPGIDLVYQGLFRLFGLNLWVTNVAVILLGLGFCGLGFSLAKELMSLRSSALAAALLLVCIYGRALTATHHWFSALAIMAAVKLCMRPITGWRILAAGSLLGLASFFTQTHGAAGLLAFALFLLWRQSRARESWPVFAGRETLLFSGFAIALLLCSAHFLLTSGWKRLWYFQIAYVLKIVLSYNQGGVLGLPGTLGWRTLPGLSQYLVVYLALPLVYLLALWRCWRERRNPSFPWERIALLSLVGLFLLIEIAFSLNWLRLYAVSMAGIVLLVWFLDQARPLRRYAIPLLWIVICCLGIRETVWGHRDLSQRVHLPGGEVVTTPQAAEELDWIAQHTRPGQSFFQAIWPGMYVPLQLNNPVFVDQVSRGSTTPSDEIALTIQQLDQKHVPYVLWTSSLDSADAALNRANDHIAPLREYLHAQYHQVRAFQNGDQFWQRNEIADRP